MPQPLIDRNFLTVGQAAQRLGLAERTVEHWIATGQLKAEPLDPNRARTPAIIPLSEIERIEREREKAK